MRRLLILLTILLLGALMLTPIVMLLDPAPVPGDFAVMWNNARLNVPVVYSLCASLVLALFYWVMKR